MQEVYKAESVEQALKIFLELVKKGEIPAGSDDLLRVYKTDPEVQGLLTNVFEPLAEVKILETPDRLFLSPNTDNKVFGYTNEQLRQRLKFDNNRELYMGYFVMLSLLAMFYGSETMEEATRTYVTVSTLEEFITGKLEGLAAREDLRDLEKELEYNLVSSVELWRDLPEYDQTLVRLRGSKNNRVSFILKVCAFLQEEGLVVVAHDREIYVTEKLHQMVRKYYSDGGRKEQLLGLIRKRGE